MELITIMITTAGSAATPGTIRYLKERGFRVVATDIDPNAAGLYLADRGYLVPPGSDPEFVPALRKICRDENVAAVVPLVDEELLAVGDLEKDGVPVLLPRRDFVAMSLDKLELMRRLDAAGIPIPATRWAPEGPGDLRFPLIVKPRSGRGSRGLGLVHDAAELEMHLAAAPYPPEALILQECVTGTEFTVSVLVWRDGAVQAVVPKEVILKEGVTRLAVTRRNAAIDEVCRRVQEAFHADGPFNVQLRLDEAGTPRIFEINPRFSSTTALTTASGVDEINGLLGQVFTGRRTLSAQWREGVVMVRRPMDEFIDEASFAERRAELLAGRPEGAIGAKPALQHRG